MKRTQERYVCQSCGAVSGKWAGRCGACGAWNSLVEEPEAAAPARAISGGGRRIALEPLSGDEAEAARVATGDGEFDRVCGGGLAAGSALLVGGDPGVGKSTLLLQIAAGLAGGGHDVVYVSGEEAVGQVRLRARRLGLSDAPVKLASETSLRDILTTLEAGRPPALTVIDSIQTMWSDALDSAPGTVAQVRACAHDLIRFAKRSGGVVILVGHVTKDGQIAGPRVVEHMVDAVLYFEGEGARDFRILRAVKNRFGPANEIGVFEMTGQGLAETPNPSELFLGDRDERKAGAAVFAGIEGSRPVLVEIQALVAPSALGTPRRAVVGWDAGRLAMTLAVLDRRCGLGLASHDVYLNVAGGLRVTEPAADLAVAAALVSSALDIALPSATVAFGEISLSGGLRPVSQAEARLKEAAKLGFERAIVPARTDVADTPLRIVGLDGLPALVDKFGRAAAR